MLTAKRIDFFNMLKINFSGVLSIKNFSVTSLIFVLTSLYVYGQSKENQDIRLLPPNETFEREMIGEQTHLYQFELKENEFFQVRVEQKGVDVALRLLDANGKELAQMDSPNSTEGPEILSFVTTTAGKYSLEIKGFDVKAKKGNYTVRREISRIATSQDRKRVEIERIFVEALNARDQKGQTDISLTKFKAALLGWQQLQDQYLANLTSDQIKLIQADELFDQAKKLSNETAVESKKASILKFAEAQRIFQETKSKTGEADCLNWIGFVYSRLGENQKALEYYNQELVIRKTIDNKKAEADTLNDIAKLYANSLNDKQKALNYFNQVILICRNIEEKKCEANALNDIGVIYADLGENQKALEYYNQSLLPRRAAKDEKGEAITLQNIGDVYADLGESLKALDYYNQQLEIIKAAADKKSEGEALNKIGNFYNNYLGERQKALDLYNQALSICRTIEEKKCEADALNNIGVNYSNTGNYQKAADYLNQAIVISRTSGDKSVEATSLSNLGLTYWRLGENQKALEYFNLANDLRKSLNDLDGTAITLHNIGLVYDDLGEREKALDYFNQALLTLRKSGNKNVEAKTLNAIGAVYYHLYEKEKAMEYFNQALQIYKTLGNKVEETAVLNNIADYYADIGEYQKALEYYSQILPILKEVSDKNIESTVTGNIGTVYMDLGEYSAAAEYLNQSVTIRRAIGDKRGEADSLHNLMFVYKSANNPLFAVFYGKQAVNAYQQLRSEVQGLDKNTQKAFSESVAVTYRLLADTLIELGRFAEAEQVLAMLKDDEFSGFVRRNADEIKNLTQKVEPNSAERKALERYTETADQITAIGTEVVKLENLKKQSGASFSEQARLDKLSQQLTDANTAFRLLLKDLEKEFGATNKKEIEVDRALQGKLQQWGNNTVALYTIMGEDRYRVVLTTPKVQVDGKTEIKAADLNKKIFEFRNALQNPKLDPRPLGKELYDILIKPIESQLAGAEAKTLIWTLDGTLRYIPFGALWDGNQYLAQKYQNVIVTSTTRQSLQSVTENDWRALGLGVSKASKVNISSSPNEFTFSELPGVNKELQTIISSEDSKENGILTGKRYIDNDFTVLALKDHLNLMLDEKHRKYNVIHFATHFRLGSDTANSFLLLGNNQALTLEQISDLSELNFTDVELVTLSACNTGFGNNLQSDQKELAESNGKEVDSLATFIENRGAKAILATLWSVADESTSLLMAEFYRLKKDNPKLTKSEVMQMAQKEMIEGKIQPNTDESKRRAEIVDTPDTKSNAPPFPFDKTKPFSHPYYWSPFILIGNWR